jgi:hypothetical protein
VMFGEMLTGIRFVFACNSTYWTKPFAPVI